MNHEVNKTKKRKRKVAENRGKIKKRGIKRGKIERIRKVKK